jgi:hypothetical protein
MGARRGLLLLLAGVAGCRSSAPAPVEIAPAVETAPSSAGAAARPIAPVAPAAGGVTTSAGRIALDDDRVYWIDAHANRPGETDAPSRVLSAPKAGGPPVELATTPTFACSIAADDAFVYVGYVGRSVPNPNACPPGRMCSQPPTIHGPRAASWRCPRAAATPASSSGTRTIPSASRPTASRSTGRTASR